MSKTPNNKQPEKPVPPAVRKYWRNQKRQQRKKEKKQHAN